MSGIESNIEIIDLEEERPNVPSEALTKKKPPVPTEAFQILKRSLNFLAIFGLIIGSDIRYDWKSNRRFALTKSIIVFIWSQFFYTQIMYVYQHNVVRTGEVFAIYGIGVSAILKIACFDEYFKNIAALFESTLRICQQNTGRRGDRLKSRLLANFTFYKFIASIAIYIAILYMFYPVKSFFIDGERVPFVPIEFMFLDQSTLFGYFIASIMMMTMGIYAISGTEYMGLTFVYLIANYSPRVDILEIDLNDLDESDPSTSTLAYRQLFLRNMCKKYIDMRQYISEIKEIFDRKMFLFFTFAYLSQILCMYQIRVNNWVPGYALAIGFFMEMIFYCVMGTQLTIANDRLWYVIIQSKWYTYDLRSQKLMLFVMNLVINSDELWIGPIAPLSVFTSTEIVKSIYTYYTVMIEVM